MTALMYIAHLLLTPDFNLQAVTFIKLHTPLGCCTGGTIFYSPTPAPPRTPTWNLWRVQGAPGTPQSLLGEHCGSTPLPFADKTEHSHHIFQLSMWQDWYDP